MSRQSEVRAAFAALLTDKLGIPVARFVPGTLRTASGYLQNGAPYLSHKGENATFGRPALSLTLVLVSPMPDWDRAMDWVDEMVDLIAAIPPTLIAGRQRPMPLDVNPLGVLDNKSLAFEVTFTTIQLGAIT